MKTQRSNELGIRLRAARKMAGLSMEDLAKRLGGIVTKQAIGKYEKGLMKPSPDVLEKLAKALDVSLPTPSAQVPFPPEFAERPILSVPPPARRRASHVRALFEAIAPKALAARSSGEETDEPWQVDQDASPLYDKILERSFVRFSRPALRHEPAPPAGLESDLALVQFRKRPHMPAKLESSLKHRIADYMRRYLDLETLLGTPAEFKPPVVKHALKDPADIEKASLDLRAMWGLGTAPIVNLLGRLEAEGIGVLEVRTDESFDGLSAHFGPQPVIAVNTALPADRVRFTAAHELAHILCDFPDRESEESLCQQFAGAFLLPRTVIESALRPAPRKLTLWELKGIKESYGISIQATMYRAHALGLITDRQWRHFRETLKANGWERTEPVAYEGREEAVRFKQLLNYAVAQSILDIDTAAALLGVPVEQFAKDMGFVF